MAERRRPLVGYPLAPVRPVRRMRRGVAYGRRGRYVLTDGTDEQAIARGVDSEALELARRKALAASGYSMARLARDWTILDELDAFREVMGMPPLRSRSEEQELADLRRTMAKYPTEAEKILAALREMEQRRATGGS